MNQSFNVELASRFGIKEAIVFEIIKSYYIRNGKKAVCIPLRLLTQHTPYIPKGTMKRVTHNLEQMNLIYKRFGYDNLLGLGNIYEITEYGMKFA